MTIAKFSPRTAVTKNSGAEIIQRKINFIDGSGVSITVNEDAPDSAIDVTVGLSGSGSNSFETISVPSGTSPVADSSTDTLTLTSSDGSVVIIGNSSTDTIDLKAVSVVSIARSFLLMGG